MGSDGFGKVIKGESSFSNIYSLDHLKQAVVDVNMLYTINLNVCKCIDNQKHMLEEYPNEVSVFVSFFVSCVLL